MYYGGANHLHNRNPSNGEREHRFGIAKWRIDGFAALEDTDGVEDTITSKTIRFSGNQLTLNADVKSTGYITVKIKSGDAEVDLKGLSDPVTGDHRKHVVRGTVGESPSSRLCSSGVHQPHLNLAGTPTSPLFQTEVTLILAQL